MGCFGEQRSTNTCADGFLGACPVGAVPLDEVGLCDMVGTVWEWTRDPFHIRSLTRAAKARDRQARGTRRMVTEGGLS
ncbi:SUMF1/EgtB/PvdO family nonheme iron enzyme [Jiella mangrovi]|uniref:SUMF1/EgtB/PvdO family nonheme iron enzyme n=1 Tax=Jiella mangrovi TaxID=2821407 RepID=A0ABS4BCD4_9HYPH|nr:SUMF1/EgtB/PvdO family nonheme iron enzyme [Jiella mangrovi]